MITVKFITKNHGGRDWLKQIPGDKGEIGSCRFIFDPMLKTYDWLVVYDDFPKKRNGEPYLCEDLSCPQESTILITSEPPSIKIYNPAYTDQFGFVLTSQPEKNLPHPRALRGPSTSLWYYGQGGERPGKYEEIARIPSSKPNLLSTVCSAKKQKHTLHYRRWLFTNELKEEIPEIEIFGHGVRPMKDKAEALAGFQYHLVFENYYGPDHWTEKLADAYLAGCLPLYHGCPNLETYFPPDSFIRFDAENPRKTANIIREAIEQDLFKQRRDAIEVARNKVLTEYNIFFRLQSLIEEQESAKKPHTNPGAKIFNRHQCRRQFPLASLRGWWKTRSL